MTDWIARIREAECLTGLQSGRYMIHGRPAHCVVTERGVTVNYDDGSFTAAFHDTFQAWGATPIEE